jgi:hypothetical protein|tara:strand:- start:227 stop:520 length:294 start_codon:yes stop_codon:yes gene_type:complete
MTNNDEQVINYGTQKLLLIGGTAHKVESATAKEWVSKWFTKNWKSVKVIRGNVHLASLATVNKTAADMAAVADYAGLRDILYAIHTGKVNHEIGITT